MNVQDKLSADEIRAILTEQAATARELRLARARLIVRYVRAGMKLAEMWAQVDLDTAELAERAEVANIEARVLMALHYYDVEGVTERGESPAAESSGPVSESDLFG